jgi:hypothetical protein
LWQAFERSPCLDLEHNTQPFAAEPIEQVMKSLDVRRVLDKRQLDNIGQLDHYGEVVDVLGRQC